MNAERSRLSVVLVDVEPLSAEVAASDLAAVGPVRSVDDPGLVEVDLALVELHLDGNSGVEAIQRLRRRWPRIRCLAYTRLCDETHIRAALRAGAAGYLLKGSGAAEVRRALCAVADGGGYLSGAVARTLFRRLQGGQTVPSQLSARQVEVLRRLASGLTYNEIAGSLGISSRTVQGHVKQIYSKLEIHTKSEAALIAAELGLVAARTRGDRGIAESEREPRVFR